MKRNITFVIGLLLISAGAILLSEHLPFENMTCYGIIAGWFAATTFPLLHWGFK